MEKCIRVIIKLFTCWHILEKILLKNNWLMQKNNFLFVAFLTMLSLLAGYLLSCISFIGKIGIGLFYHEYRFLKVWWKGSLIVFAIWIVLFVAHTFYYHRLRRVQYHIFSTLSLVVALAGLYLSYTDFRNDLSHRWLGERFHLGVYLFWLVWVAIVIFVYQNNRRKMEQKTLSTPTE